MNAKYLFVVTWADPILFEKDYPYARFGADDFNAGLTHALSLRPAGAETWIEIVEMEP